MATWHVLLVAQALRRSRSRFEKGPLLHNQFVLSSCGFGGASDNAAEHVLVAQALRRSRRGGRRGGGTAEAPLLSHQLATGSSRATCSPPRHRGGIYRFPDATPPEIRAVELFFGFLFRSDGLFVLGFVCVISSTRYFLLRLIHIIFTLIFYELFIHYSFKSIFFFV